MGREEGRGSSEEEEELSERRRRSDFGSAGVMGVAKKECGDVGGFMVVDASCSILWYG